jgi:hypothetical protein
VKLLWAAICGTLSQVRVAITALGNRLTCSPRALTTLSVSLPLRRTRASRTVSCVRPGCQRGCCATRPRDPLPVSGHRPILGLGRTLTDGAGLLDPTARLTGGGGVATLRIIRLERRWAISSLSRALLACTNARTGCARWSRGRSCAWPHREDTPFRASRRSARRAAFPRSFRATASRKKRFVASRRRHLLGGRALCHACSSAF